MPMLIEHLDAIARKKGRDVLFLDFPQKETEDIFDFFNADWDNVAIRQQVIAWLNPDYSLDGFRLDWERRKMSGVRP